jgi:hypothetical protein
MKKKTVLLFTLIFTSILAYSQENKPIGTWKVISIDNGELYYNQKNDMLTIHEKFKDEFGSDIELTKTIIKMTYGETVFVFDKENNYIQKSQLAEFKLKYKINSKKLKILLFDKENINKKNNTTEIKYHFNNNILILDFSKGDMQMKFELEKQI